jgi:RNA polymerase sigma-70 factor (family 1)
VPTEPSYNEKEILQQIAAGEEPAFAQLYDRYHQKLYSFAFFLTRSAELAEEITQEIFIKIWTHRHELSGINYFNSWLRTLVRNQAYDQLRRLAHERLIFKAIAYGPEPNAPVTETDVADREYNRLLERAIDQLSPQQKIVYRLSRQEGLAQEAIAQSMGLSLNTVKNHMKAALRSIRTYLDKHTDTLILLAIALFLSE